MLGSNGKPASVGLRSYENWGLAKSLPPKPLAAAKASGTPASRSPALSFALPGRVLADLGVPLLSDQPKPKV